MSDFLKKLKGLFIVPTEETPPPTDTPPVQENTTPPPSINTNNNSGQVVSSVVKGNNPPPTSINPSSVNTNGQLDENVMNTLLKAIENNNQPGFDYIEYRNALASIGAMGMTEEMRYKSALAMAQAMGVKAENLLSSVGFYLDILKKEESKFMDALSRQGSDRLTKQTEETKALEKAINDKNAQILQLQQDIEKHKADFDKKLQETEELRLRVELTRNNFTATYTALSGQLQEDLNKMKQYLK